MKTVIVLSDSHGRRSAIEKIAPLFAENDYAVHLGDGSSDMRPYASEKTVILKGNCDPCYGEQEKVLDTEGVKIFCCHGHRYGVKSGLEKLAARAAQLGCTVALYGHTHRAAAETVNGVLCVNPGSLGSFSDPGYCYLVLHNGKVTYTLVPLQR